MLNPQYTVQYFSDVCKHKTEICEVWWVASSYQKKKKIQGYGFGKSWDYLTYNIHTKTWAGASKRKKMACTRRGSALIYLLPK